MAVRKSDLADIAIHEDTIQVLIIDDSPSDRDYYARCLRDHGFTVTVAATGEQGRRKLDQVPFDCVLLDYYMPCEDGIDVLNAIRIDPTRPATPVVMMTGAGSEDIAVSAWKSGAADYLCKDKITPDALQRAVFNAVEKARLRQTVAEHAAELEDANRKLRKRSDEIKRFYLTISHELNTPLAAARECVSLVYDGVAGTVSPEAQEYLEDAIESHDQLAEHLKDLIESTRLDNGKLQIFPKPILLERVVRRALAANARLARSRNVDIETQIPEHLSKVIGDKDRLVQVLCNLLSNAIKHSHASHSVLLRVTPIERKVLIEVVDKGCGIEEIHHTGIFERLFQVPKSGAEGGGLGLGLSIAQEIVKLHGSSIVVQSEPNQGSNFSFELDVAADH